MLDGWVRQYEQTTAAQSAAEVVSPHGALRLKRWQSTKSAADVTREGNIKDLVDGDDRTLREIDCVISWASRSERWFSRWP